jgi:Arc/MetJ-type ribon-helix-helix transcriptional regulator
MKTVKLNFTIPEDIVGMLKARIGEGNRSAFVGAAIRSKLNQLEQEQLRQTLIEGYLARRDEDAEVSREWEKPTLEGWR